MTIISNPELLLKKLIDNSSSRTQKSLRLINKICSEQVERGSKDFKYSTIGKLSAKEGGPGHGAIRNKSGEPYRLLISSWDKRYGGITKNSVSRLKEEDWIEDIAQHDIRWLVRDKVHEAKALRNENNLLKSQIVLNIDLREPNIKNENKTAITTLPSLTNSEILALKHAISEQHINEMGWINDHRGKVSDNNNSQIFKSGFITAIEKILTIYLNSDIKNDNATHV